MLQETGPGGNVTAAGDIVSYQINVTNTGNVDLTNVTVTDPHDWQPNGNNDTNLSIGEQRDLYWKLYGYSGRHNQ